MKSSWKGFEKLFSEDDFGLTGKEIDPDKIINGNFRENKIVKMPDDVSQTTTLLLPALQENALKKRSQYAPPLFLQVTIARGIRNPA